MCIFLLKFHCELNFIEYFWGKAKRYIQKNCDGPFKTLKENFTHALQSVKLATICHWEHHMHWWMDAYHSGLSMKEAQVGIAKGVDPWDTPPSNYREGCPRGWHPWQSLGTGTGQRIHISHIRRSLRQLPRYLITKYGNFLMLYSNTLMMPNWPSLLKNSLMNFEANGNPSYNFIPYTKEAFL